MGTRNGSIAQMQCAIFVVHQREGDIMSAGNKELIVVDSLVGSGVVEGCFADISQISVGHVPLCIIIRLDSHIAVFVKQSSQLAVYELVFAHVGIVCLTAVVRTIDIAEQVVGFVGYVHTADGTGLIHRIVLTGQFAVAANALVPAMSTQCSGLQLVDRSGFHLAGVGGSSIGRITPGGPLSPLLSVGYQVVGGVGLLVNIHGEPIGSIGAGGVGCAVAVVSGITGIVAGIYRVIIGMESVVGIGLIGPGGGLGGVAPVIPQITDLHIGIDDRFGGGRLPGGDLGIIVLLVNNAGLIEAGGPGGNISHRVGTALDPGLRGAVRITVLSLGGKQTGIHAIGNFLQPLIGHIGCVELVVITASRAGVLIDLIFRAGGLMDLQVILMGSLNGLPLRVAAACTTPGTAAVYGTGSIDYDPVCISVIGGRYGFFFYLAAFTAGNHTAARSGTGGSLKHRGAVGVAAAGLAHRRGDDHKVFLCQRYAA